MKRTLYLAIVMLFVLYTGKASADISVKDYMSYDFLHSQGYSGEMVKLVELNKARTFGEKIPSHWSRNIIVRSCQKAKAYFDPAADYGDFGEHEIKMHTTMWDY